jgi:uncharacterized protein (DUF302 family)
MHNDTTSLDVIEINATRVVFTSALGFEDMLSEFKKRIGPMVAFEKIITLPGGWEQYEDAVSPLIGESGFVSIAEMDYTGWLAKYEIHRKVMRWIIGNPMIAITMVKHDQTASLFVPVEMLLAEESGNEQRCTVTYMRPSSLIAFGENPALLEAARKLDDKLEALIASVMH